MDGTRKRSKQKARPRVTRSRNAQLNKPIPYHKAVDDAIKEIAEMGPAPLLAVLLRIVLKDRITDQEVQLICDTFYHD